MNIAAIGILVHALMTVTAGAVDYFQAGSVASFLVGLVCSAALLFAGLTVLQGSYAAIYAALGLIMFVGGFFGYQFISAGRFVPSGLMLIFCFVALGVVSVGLFISLMNE